MIMKFENLQSSLISIQLFILVKNIIEVQNHYFFLMRAMWYGWNEILSQNNLK